MTRRAASLIVVALMLAWPGSGGTQTSQPPGATESRKDDKSADKPEQMAAHTAVGRVKSVGADRLVVAGKSKGQAAEWTFVLDAGTKIRKGGKDITAADLKEGDAVQVRYLDQGGRNVAQTVRARSGPPATSPNPTEKKP